MKANEIMTGDYFRIAQTGKIIKIVAVDEPSGSVDYFDGDAGGVLTIGVEKIEPIPLTAEILENNADGGWCNYSDAPSGRAIYHFGKVAIYVEWERYQPYVELHGLGSTFYKDYIPSVHKLQHALRLCGIDKEITI